MFIYIVIGIFFCVEGLRAVLPYKARNNRTKIYRTLVFASATITPLVLSCLVLNHIFRWDVSVIDSKPLCFIILLGVLILSELFNIHEIKAIKKGKEEVGIDEA